jgi:hypothetical protein
MKLWLSGEIGLGSLDNRFYRETSNTIEDDLNNYLKSIGYSNDKLTKVRLILIIRNDNISMTGGEECRNSRMERLNGSMRREFFDAYLFDSLAEVKMMTEEWVYDYNNYRPHSTLGKLSPIEYLDKYHLEMNYSV